MAKQKRKAAKKPANGNAAAQQRFREMMQSSHFRRWRHTSILAGGNPLLRAVLGPAAIWWSESHR